MAKNKSIEFDAWKLVELGNTAELAGQLELAEGYYKQALRKFKSKNNRQGEAVSLNNLGLIAETQGDLAEAEQLHRESLAIKRDWQPARRGSSLNNLGLIAKTQSDLAEAERLYRESLAIEERLATGKVRQFTLNNLGPSQKRKATLLRRNGCTESLAIEREVGDRKVEAVSLNNLGVIAKRKASLDEAERLFRESGHQERLATGKARRLH